MKAIYRLYHGFGLVAVQHSVDAMVRLSSTRFNYWFGMLVDMVLGITFLALGTRHASPLVGIICVVAGMFSWSFLEYVFHRWLFHSGIPTLTESHDRHHDHPTGTDAVPFFIPPLVALGLFTLLSLLLTRSNALLFVGGAGFFYMLYGQSHHIIHHTRFRHPMLRRWAAHHHIHHHHQHTNFGVTTPLWDYLLGTRYVSQSAGIRKRN